MGVDSVAPLNTEVLSTAACRSAASMAMAPSLVASAKIILIKLKNISKEVLYLQFCLFLIQYVYLLEGR